MTLARRERANLVELFGAVGPDAPTLCGGWNTRDLAAHLITRERRPDAGIGVVAKPLEFVTERIRRGYLDRPWDDLVATVGSGPPKWSPFGLFDTQFNTVEFFVHHEDVRRATPGRQPRELAADDRAALWSVLRTLARFTYRKSPVTVALRSPAGDEIVVRPKRDRRVVLTGDPGELLLHAFGRDEVVLDTDGDPADVEAVLHLDGRGF